MRTLLIFLILLALAGCEATPVQNAAAIKTKEKLAKNIQLPVALPVAYYVDKHNPEDKINFYGKMEEAADLVLSDMFENADMLSVDTDFEYLFIIKSSSDWDVMWGGWDSDIQVTVKDRRGDSVFTTSLTKSTSGGGGLYDFNAVYNAFAGALKDVSIQFLNRQSNIVEAVANNTYERVPANQYATLKMLLGGLDARGSGSGFFINNSGQSVTAAHVIDDCIFIEVNHKGTTFDAEVLNKSRLLDLAVLQINYQNQVAVTIEPEASISLGKQIFATGFPLSGILSEYPSLTVGNISSKGGLKGAQGMFQFTAPIQPGNSGGAISDYKGNLMGVVSSTLNQAMMLRDSGTTSQNVNFGIDSRLLANYLSNNNIAYNSGTSAKSFEQSSADAVEFSTQILCYQ